MTTPGRRVFGLTAALGCLAVVVSAPASSAPECTDTAPNTRMCARSPGHTAIITSPDPALTNPYPGWGFGGIGIPAIGLGGGGIWIGF